MSNKPERKRTRLNGFDYASPGIYFVTICTRGHICLFGDVVGGEMRLNIAGELVRQTWESLPDIYPYIDIEPYIIMPNHVHGLITIYAAEGLPNPGSFTPTLHGVSEIVRGFKTWSARRVNKLNKTTGTSLWQNSFYDRIIRNEKEWENAAAYIEFNPIRWNEDKNNPTVG